MGVVFKPFCDKCDSEMTETEVEIDEELSIVEEINAKGMVHHLKNVPKKIIKITVTSFTLDKDVDIKFNKRDITFEKDILILATSYKDTLVKSVEYVVSNIIKMKEYNCSNCGQTHKQ